MGKEILNSRKGFDLLLLKGIWICSIIGFAIAAFIAIKQYFAGFRGEDLVQHIFYGELWFVVSTLIGIGVVFTHHYANKAVKFMLRFVGITYGVYTGILLRDITSKHSLGIDWGDLTLEWCNLGAILVVIIVIGYTYHRVYTRVKEE